MASTTEYERLGGHLPQEVEELVRAYAAPIYRRPNHAKCIQSSFGVLKQHAISWVIFNEIVMLNVPRSIDSLFEEQYKSYLLPMQVGQICEDEDMDITITSFVDYLIERDVLKTQPK